MLSKELTVGYVSIPIISRELEDRINFRYIDSRYIELFNSSLIITIHLSLKRELNGSMCTLVSTKKSEAFVVLLYSKELNI